MIDAAGDQPLTVLKCIAARMDQAIARGSRPGRPRRDRRGARVTVCVDARQCCIVGGGPAGMMLGYLLARAGVDVAVLEKHARLPARFSRRHGPSVHARGDARARAARRVPQAAAPGSRATLGGDSSATRRSRSPTSRHLPTHCKFIALMPQWDFLDFLAEQAKRYPAFPSADADRSDRSHRRGRPRRRRARRDAGRRSSRCAPIWSSAPTAATRPCASAAGLAGRRSRRADRRAVDAPVTHARRSRTDARPHSSRAACSSRSTAATTGSARSSFRRAASTTSARRGSTRSATTIAAGRAVPCAIASHELRDWDDVKLLTVRSIACATGTGPASSASATPRTRCRRSAASASISRSRMRSRRRTFWRRRCAAASTDSRSRARCSGGASCRRARRSVSRC